MVDKSDPGQLNQSRLSKTQPGTTRKPRPTILIVEDDVSTLQVGSFILQRAGFMVREAINGLQAIGIIQTEAIDAVVLDLSMPRMDGIGVLHTLTMLRRYSHIPVVVVTAISDAQVIAEARAAGADEILHKPYLPDDVIAAVYRCLETSLEASTQADQKQQE